MADKNFSVFCNGIFEFEVGICRFAVHRSLVSRASPTLYALVENGMRESQEKFATIPDVKEETFARFVEFLYTGDYNTTQPAPIQEPPASTHESGAEDHKTDASRTDADSPLHEQEDPAERHVVLMPEPAPAPPEPDLDPWQWSASKKDKKRGKQTTSTPEYSDRAKSKLPNLNLDVSTMQPLITSPKIHRNVTGRNDYTAVFFCHAQLYVLGDIYGVGRLKLLACERLNRAFRHYQRAEKPSADFSGLFRYVFEHTPQRDMRNIDGDQNPHAPFGDTLQEICVHFAANNLESLTLLSDFRCLLREGGPFVEMFVSRVAERFTRME